MSRDTTHPPKWFIQVPQDDGDLYWSNEDGWVDLRMATAFRGDELEKYSVENSEGIIVPVMAGEPDARWVQFPTKIVRYNKSWQAK
jgi:hypothetical protein